MNSPEFLKATPDVINACYSLDTLNIDSEDSLVLKLDEYITKNLELTTNIRTKLKPAILSIRLLTLEQSTTINDCKDPELKNILSNRLKKLHSPSTYGPVPPIMKVHRRNSPLSIWLAGYLLNIIARDHPFITWPIFGPF